MPPRKPLLLLFALTALLVLIVVIVTASGAAAASDDDDDIIVDDLGTEPDSKRRSRFANEEQDMVFEDFADEIRQREKKKQQQQQRQEPPKQKPQQQQQRQEKPKSQQQQKPKSQETPKSQQQQQQQQHHRPTPTSTPKPARTLTEQLQAILTSLDDIRGSFTGTSHHLARISAANKHFNSSLNAPANLKIIRTLLPSFGTEHFVDGDTLESASSLLGNARYEHYSIKQKVAKHEKALNKKETDAASDLKDVKLQQLHQNLRIAEAKMKDLVAIEQAHRTLHVRLLRSVRATAPTTLKFVREVVAIADARLTELRGIRAGEIDSAAPAGDVREGRKRRKELQAKVHKLKEAEGGFVRFAKLVESQMRRGRGVTKAMEPLFVFFQLMARHGLSEDVIDVLKAADEIASSSSSLSSSSPSSSDQNDGRYFAFGDFLLYQHGFYHEVVDVPLSETKADTEKRKRLVESDGDFHMAKKIFEMQPITPTAMLFGLEQQELIGLLLALLVPAQLFNLLYFVIATKLLPLITGRGAAAAAAAAAAAQKAAKNKKFAGAGQKLGGSGDNKSSDKKSNPPAMSSTASYVVVFVVLFAQLALLLISVDAPLISDKMEELPINPRDRDITLPAVLTSAIRFQVNEHCQGRLCSLVVVIALFQALMCASTISSHVQSVADQDAAAKEAAEQ